MTDRSSRPLDPAEFLAQRVWMRRFPAALAGAEGEDLVQEAWVRVLTARAPALTRAWLASVLLNAARMRKRGAIRREQREAQAAREEALASTDELVAQAELEQLAVLALSAPYRNRIARGLAEVRAELDRRHGRREAWLLLAPRAVLGKGTAAMIVGGGIWMSTKWIAAAAALTAAGALLWVGRSGRTHTLHAATRRATRTSGSRRGRGPRRPCCSAWRASCSSVAS